ncbi:MAG: LemA family protein [Thermoguttaceae bacterium]|nr:LemA family protein [Thermoguttaceae bacterium]
MLVFVARIVFAGVCAATLGASLVKTFKVMREKRLIEETPTVKAKGVFIGTVELRGKATLENARPLIASISGLPCVYLRNELQKSVGGEWFPVSRPAKRLKRFTVRDETGSVDVVTRGGDLRPRLLGERLLSPVLRVREYGIPLDSEVYVLGKARFRADASVPEIVADESQCLYISTKGEESVVREKMDVVSLVSFRGMLACAALGGGALSGAAKEDFFFAAFWGAILGTLVYFFIYSFCSFVADANSLIDLNRRLRCAKSNVDVELTRRSDLFLALTSAAQAWTRQEREVEEALATLRLQAEFERPTVSFDGGSRPWSPTLQALGEEFPQLAALPAFAYLQKSVADAEKRLAFAREYYNGVANVYEERRGAFPMNVLAFLLQFPKARFF